MDDFEADRWRLTATKIADDVLFPAAMDVERAEHVPRQQLDLLAAANLYGIAAPPDLGGLGLQRFDVLGDVVASLAGGCLASAFIWIQHLAPIIAVSTTAEPEFRNNWLGPLARGDHRSGIAMAGIRPGPGRIRVEPAAGGFRLSGETAWVTGWGLIDTLLVGAIDEQDIVHFFLIDAVDSPTLITTCTQLLAVQASSTVTLRFEGHFVPKERLGRTQPYADWVAGDAGGSSLNGFLALGVAARCARLLHTDELDPDLARCRTALLTAPPAAVPAARADTSLLALRAATELMVHTGSRSVLADQHAGRLYREAGFLLVFGSRPAIKSALQERLRG
ncbi:MAG: acyl-CoA dehydrogenase family protein [Nakamurella sp.]